MRSLAVRQFLEFQDVSKYFGPVRAVDHVSLSVKRGEFFSLLGPSGCGKTTLLRIVAGFEYPDTGVFCSTAKTSPTSLPTNAK